MIKGYVPTKDDFVSWLVDKGQFADTMTMTEVTKAARDILIKVELLRPYFLQEAEENNNGNQMLVVGCWYG